MRISALKNCRIQGIIGRMSNDFKLIVHFSCPHCATIYTACQENSRRRHPGDFRCRMCSTPVHEWAGLYNFTGWQLAAIPRKKRTRRELW